MASAAGTVNVGTVTFTLLDSTTVVGTAVTVSVVAGAASASYTLPAGTASGSYIIQATYTGTANFGSSSDNTQRLTVGLAVVAATTTTAATSTSVVFSASSQAVTLSATVSSPAGTVNEGTETFTLLSGTTVIGTPVTVNVVAGAASASYGLPAALSPASYSIQAVYNGTADFSGSSDTSQSLTVTEPTTASTPFAPTLAPQARRAATGSPAITARPPRLDLPRQRSHSAQRVREPLRRDQRRQPGPARHGDPSHPGHSHDHAVGNAPERRDA